MLQWIQIIIWSSLTNADNSSVSVIDPNKNYTMVKKIIVGNKPNEMFINPQSRELYVVNKLSDTLSILSTKDLYVKRTILLGKQPFAVTYDNTSGLIYVSVSTQNPDAFGLSVINPFKKEICEMSETLLGTRPSSVMFDPHSNLTYVSNTDTNTISGIRVKALEGQN